MRNYFKLSIAFFAQLELVKIALPTPIRSALPLANNSSAALGVTIPPVRITGIFDNLFNSFS